LTDRVAGTKAGETKKSSTATQPQPPPAKTPQDTGKSPAIYASGLFAQTTNALFACNTTHAVRIGSRLRRCTATSPV